MKSQIFVIPLGIEIDFKLLQFLKALLEMFVTLLGIVIDSILSQFSNRLVLIIETPLGILIDFKFIQPAKAPQPI